MAIKVADDLYADILKRLEGDVKALQVSMQTKLPWDLQTLIRALIS